jgi:hypothetical protein
MIKCKGFPSRFPRVAVRSASFLVATVAVALIFSMPAAASLTSTDPVPPGTQNPVTFAQFLEATPGNDFVITDHGTSDTLTTLPGGVQVLFLYHNIANLSPALSGALQATLTVTATSVTPAVVIGATLTETDWIGNFSFILDTPVNGQSNLLSGTFGVNANISGGNNSGASTFSDSSAFGPNEVVFSSSFISFPGVLEEDMSLAFSGMNPSFSRGLGNFLANSTAQATGSFDANPVPESVPEPGSVFPMGAGLLGVVGFASRYAAATRKCWL